MSLLSNLPHRVDQLRAAYTQGELRGSTRTWAIVARSISCWVQRLTAKEVEMFDARQVSVSKKVYFEVDPGITEDDLLRFVDPETGNTLHLEVKAMEDAGVHQGGPFRAMCGFFTGDVDASEEA